MIHVDRARVSFPEELAHRWREESSRLRAFVTRGDAQRRLPFKNARLSRALRPTLYELFRNKCAYCESEVGVSSPGDVDLFRPKSQIRQLDGAIIRPGYWWLAYEWANQYLACDLCNRLFKRDLFPVAGEYRARSPEDDLSEEKRLLIDPCEDEPAEHLWFAGAGRVEPLTARGATTIEVLNLNRDELRLRRRQVLPDLSIQHIRWRRGEPSVDGLTRVLEEVLGEAQPYLGPIRQWVGQLLVESWDGWPRGLQAEIEERVAVLGVRLDLVRAGLARRAAKRPAEPAVAVTAPGQAYINSIEVRNFKGIKSLKLALDPLRLAARAEEEKRASLAPVEAEREPAEEEETTDEAQRGWSVLLGENAVGKSSVLEAVALGLMGREAGPKANKAPSPPRPISVNYLGG